MDDAFSGGVKFVLPDSRGFQRIRRWKGGSLGEFIFLEKGI